MIDIQDDELVMPKGVSQQLFFVKSQKKEVDNQVKILKNRILMLNNEESKQNQIIQNQQLKIYKLKEIDQFRREINHQVLFLFKMQQTQIRLNKQQQMNQRKVQTFRLSQDLKIQQSKQQQHMKKKENLEICKQAHSNYEAGIQKYNLSCQNMNRLRANYIKDCRQEQKESIKQFWENKIHNYSVEKQILKEQLEKEKIKQDRLLQYLLDEENRRIARLQESFEVKQKLQNIMQNTSKNRFTKLSEKKQQSPLDKKLADFNQQSAIELTKIIEQSLKNELLNIKTNKNLNQGSVQTQQQDLKIRILDAQKIALSVLKNIRQYRKTIPDYYLQCHIQKQDMYVYKDLSKLPIIPKLS